MNSIFILTLTICSFSWILRSAYYWAEKERIEYLVYKMLPRKFYSIDPKRNFATVVSIIYLFIYIFSGVFLLYNYRNYIGSFLIYVTNMNLLDIFLILPALLAYCSIIGFIILWYYIILGKNSEQRYDAVLLTPVGLFSEAIESIFWWGLVFVLLIEENFRYNLWFALYVSVIYGLIKMSSFINALRNKIFPVVIVVHSFVTMFFNCMLVVVGENIIYPVFYNSFILLIMQLDKWLRIKGMFKKGHFFRRKAREYS